jgi:hypothetical protein
MGVSKCLSKHNHKNANIENGEKNTCKISCARMWDFLCGSSLARGHPKFAMGYT